MCMVIWLRTSASASWQMSNIRVKDWSLCSQWVSLCHLKAICHSIKCAFNQEVKKPQVNCQWWHDVLLAPCVAYEITRDAEVSLIGGGGTLILVLYRDLPFWDKTPLTRILLFCAKSYSLNKINKNFGWFHAFTPKTRFFSGNTYRCVWKCVP